MTLYYPIPHSIIHPFAGWCWPNFITDSREMRIKAWATLAASYLTDPICKVREYTWQLRITEQMLPADTKVKLLFQLGRIGCLLAAIPTTFPGMALRYLIQRFQTVPYLHLKGTYPPKTLVGKEITVYSANRANVAGGYAITDGGVAPWIYRIDKQIKEIIDQDADVVCLSELFDPTASFNMYEALKKAGYTEFYFNPGAKPVAPGAGLFVASKYAIQDLHFVSFPEATLQGRTKWSCKGFFRFDIVSNSETIARFYSTHLQHSEETQFPHRNPTIKEITQDVIVQALKKDCEDDVVARAAQMHLIMEDISKHRSFAAPVIVTGDLNMNEQERNQSRWSQNFTLGTQEYGGRVTWGGDQFCVGLTGGTKRASVPCNLDYTLLYGNTSATLKTSLIDAGFDGTRFNPEAVSDHSALVSVITLH